MLVKCETCPLYFDDEFRTTICPHETFAANDGQNNFAHHPEAYLGVQPMTKVADFTYETLNDTNTQIYRPRNPETIELSKLNAMYADLYDRQQSYAADIVKMEREIETRKQQVMEIEDKLNDIRQKIVTNIGMEVPCPK